MAVVLVVESGVDWLDVVDSNDGVVWSGSFVWDGDIVLLDSDVSDEDESVVWLEVVSVGCDDSVELESGVTLVELEDVTVLSVVCGVVEGLYFSVVLSIELVVDSEVIVASVAELEIVLPLSIVSVEDCSDFSVEIASVVEELCSLVVSKVEEESVIGLELGLLLVVCSEYIVVVVPSEGSLPLVVDSPFCSVIGLVFSTPEVVVPVPEDPLVSHFEFLTAQG